MLWHTCTCRFYRLESPWRARKVSCNTASNRVRFHACASVKRCARTALRLAAHAPPQPRCATVPANINALLLQPIGCTACVHGLPARAVSHSEDPLCSVRSALTLFVRTWPAPRSACFPACRWSFARGLPGADTGVSACALRSARTRIFSSCKSAQQSTQQRAEVRGAAEVKLASCSRGTSNHVANLGTPGSHRGNTEGSSRAELSCACLSFACTGSQQRGWQSAQNQRKDSSQAWLQDCCTYTPEACCNKPSLSLLQSLDAAQAHPHQLNHRGEVAHMLPCPAGAATRERGKAQRGHTSTALDISPQCLQLHASMAFSMPKCSRCAA